MAIASNNIYRRSAAFEPVIVIAIIRELACREDQLVARVVDRLRELVNPKLVAHMRRPWGRSTPSGLGFFDSVQELHVTGLFRLGPLQSLPVNLDLFKEKWDLVP
jgi:hypothetical protein